ncbi:hypothetical protein ACP4OV_017205 [Aristida adscensionis]
MSSTDVSWLRHLRFLEYLDLSLVDLSGATDWPHVVNMLPTLRALYLSGCKLASANQSLPHINLTNLEKLDLYGNNLDHPVASCWFWNITHLKHLNVGYNYLYAQVPAMLEEMTALQVLDFSYNSLNLLIMSVNLRKLCNLEVLMLDGLVSIGDITNFLESLPHCALNKLQKLHLSEAKIGGVLPNRMGHFTSLTNIDLSHNNISGPLPSFIGHLTNLRDLDISCNHLNGSVPYEIGMLTNLTHLRLNDNDLDGVITEEHFSSLESLEDIDLSYNSLRINISTEWEPPFIIKYAKFAACQMGPLFPSWLRWSVGVEVIDISSAGIIDSLPDWFSNVFSDALLMNMSNNQLNGSLPTNMQLMSTMEQLYLSSNQITGQIPPLPPNLTTLDMSMNSLSGPLPSSFGVPNLELLFLYSNRITGQIPRSICNSERLMFIDLANNFLEGELPQCFGPTLVSLQLSNNNLSGEFPSFLQNFTMLSFLDLSRNKFSGTLPVWIGNLGCLQILWISHNMFSGNIPISMTKLECLQYFDAADNDISGSLPGDLFNLKAMTQNGECNCQLYPDVSDALSLSIAMKGEKRSYGTIYNYLNMGMIGIDLSLNNLSGDLPEGIGTLDALVNFNLSRNHLTGKIPNKIGGLLSLESLDLSRNMLSGHIPASLSNLTFLAYLDLSYNNLTGEIPSGSQLDTLYDEHPTMYSGNNGLCGAPLKKSCSNNHALEQGHFNTTSSSEEGQWPEFFYLGLGCGFVVGAWVVLCATLFSNRWRIAWFHLFDKLYDRAYVLILVTWARVSKKRAAN